MQTKKQSFIETLTNIVVGLITSFIIQIYIYDFFKIPVTLNQNIYITLIFFISSVIRGYSIRRMFNYLNYKTDKPKSNIYNKVKDLFLKSSNSYYNFYIRNRNDELIEFRVSFNDNNNIVYYYCYSENGIMLYSNNFAIDNIHILDVNLNWTLNKLNCHLLYKKIFLNKLNLDKQ
jgi:hypothetical protein